MIVDSTYFTFNKIYYKQIFRTPMGSPLSIILADIILQDVEEVALNRLPVDLPFYFRYVDDIFLAARMNSLNFILKTFNSFHAKLKFIMEISRCDHISSLGINLIENRKIIFDLFKKPTNSDRYLNFLSNHPIEHKKRVIIINLFDRILLLSHPRFQSKNLTKFTHTAHFILRIPQIVSD